MPPRTRGAGRRSSCATRRTRSCTRPSARWRSRAPSSPSPTARAVEQALNEAREALKGEDGDEIRRAQDNLTRAAQTLAEADVPPELERRVAAERPRQFAGAAGGRRGRRRVQGRRRPEVLTDGQPSTRPTTGGKGRRIARAFDCSSPRGVMLGSHRSAPAHWSRRASCRDGSERSWSSNRTGRRHRRSAARWPSSGGTSRPSRGAAGLDDAAWPDRHGDGLARALDGGLSDGRPRDRCAAQPSRPTRSSACGRPSTRSSSGSLRLLADFDNLRRRTAREQETARREGAARGAPAAPVGARHARARARRRVHRPRFLRGRGGHAPTVHDAPCARRAPSPSRASGSRSIRRSTRRSPPLPSESVEPGTVVREVRRGWRLGDELLRPAQVVVAAAARRPPTRGGEVPGLLRGAGRAAHRHGGGDQAGLPPARAQAPPRSPAAPPSAPRPPSGSRRSTRPTRS